MKRLSRRTFGRRLGCAVGGPAFAAVAASGAVDVVIVGAGAAGIAAARRLIAAGRRVALVEATDRVGGRCFTDTRTFGVPYDRGAHWIPCATAIRWRTGARKAGADVYPAPPGPDLRIGRRNAREGEAEIFLASLVRATPRSAEAARGKADLPCAQALPRDLGEWRSPVEFVLGPYGCGKDLAEVSAMDFARAAERDVDAFCRQGFGTLLARLAQGLPVQLSTPVTRIEWVGGPLEVQTVTPGRLTPRAIIVTVSTNALALGQNQIHSRAAAPAARRGKQAQARQLRSHRDRAGGQPAPVAARRPAVREIREQSHGRLLANVSGTNLSVIEVGGQFGRELSANGEQAMVAFAGDWLAGLYGSDIRKAIKRTHATQWNNEPWTLGAFSTASPARNRRGGR